MRRKSSSRQKSKQRLIKRKLSKKRVSRKRVSRKRKTSRQKTPNRGCSRSFQSKYITRPGPPYPAQDCKNRVLLGNDREYYESSPDINGIYKWKKINRK